MKKTFVALAVLLALPLSAQAAGSYGYGGVGFGKSKFEVTDDGGFTSISRDENKNAFVLYGGAQLTPNWGVEIGYADFGTLHNVYRISGVTVSADDKAYSVYTAGIATLPVSSLLSLFGKIGLSQAHSDITASSGSASLGSSGYKNSVLAGLSAEFNFSKQVSTAIEYDDFGKVADDVKVKTWFFSARYKFR
ncbi:MAG: outer membrane beta-barrel protein [Sulfuricaulis sp.]